MKRQIVAAYNVSAMGAVVLDRAIALACAAPDQVLHVVTVIDPGAGSALHPVGPDGVDYVYAEAVAAALARVVDEAVAVGAAERDVPRFVHARIGKPAVEILDLAREAGADHVLMGIHDVGGVRRLLMGSTARQVVRDAECTVTVVRAGAYPPARIFDIVDAPPHPPHHYHPPHRYHYTDDRVLKRPADWPLL
jgi:nucleotide-binding universal stress UspA family protein